MTTIYDIAEDLIQHTDCSVFVTGKAGSGKTTMLRQIKEGALKQTAIVAPTGVAAINAQGMTMHSLFQLPFSPFIPTMEGRHDLISKQQISEVRRKVFRELELLIIDEISMVRADTLDAIDTILRHYRYRPSIPFGGVQVVYIGDMYQLPPVCIGGEWELLSQYYQSPYFFHSKVVCQQPPIYIELDKIFRQSNLQFINLLNEVRNNHLSPESFGLLNKRYRPGYRAVEGDGYITLTTHNASADAINDEEISKIDAPYYTFTATIKDDFPEKSYPTDLNLQLKLGAKVMFIANDMAQPRRYYNGKLGVITDINKDEIWVTCDDETEPIPVSVEVWENKSYTLNKQANRLDEKLLGTFTQYPLRLAWAITIHKSQGLTFDKVIIDAGAAFASGQVYVALSRCRSLDGIILTSPINPYSLTIDRHILEYGNNKLPVAELEQKVELFKQQYSILLLARLFSIEDLMSQTTEFYRYISRIVEDFNEETRPFIDELNRHVNELYSVALRFVNQLNSYDPRRDSATIQQRVKAAATYYSEHLDKIITHIESSPAITESKTEALDYVERLQPIFETAHRLRQIIAEMASDMSVTHYFTAKQNVSTPKFKVKAYAVDREVRLLKTDNPTLFARLSYWRNNYCKENDMPVYIVASNASLADVSNQLPLTARQLEKVKGFGKKKAERFGQAILDIVRQYCLEIGVDVDTQSTVDFDANAAREPDAKYHTSTTGDQSKAPRKTKKEKVSTETKTDTIEVTFNLIQKGKTPAEIAELRSLTTDTIYNHISKLIRQHRLTIDPYIDASLLKKVMARLNEKPEQSNAELHEYFDGKIEYQQLLLIRAHQLSLDNQNNR